MTGKRMLTRLGIGVAVALALTMTLSAVQQTQTDRTSCASWPGPSCASWPTSVPDAAMAGDGNSVRALLKNGADVRAAQGDGMTALHWAATRGDVPMTTMLLKAGADVTAPTRLGAYTALLLAAQRGYTPVVEALVAAGADVNGADASGTTVLMFAAAAGRADMVKALVSRGADVHARERVMDQTALMFAAAYDRVDAIRALIAAGADIAATSRVTDLAALTEPVNPGGAGGPRPQAPSRTQVAGLNRQFRYNELVSKQGGLTPLLFAARQGHAAAVDALLDLGADINQVCAGDRTSPLVMATINGHFDMAMRMIARGADVTVGTEGGVTPLYAVLNIYWGPKSMYPQPRAQLQQTTAYLDLMRVLIDNGADVNARVTKKVWFTSFNTDLSGVDEIGATPFWRAAYASDVDAMRLLVGAGADPNVPTMRPAARARAGDGDRSAIADVSGRPPVPVGGPGVPPLLAAAGVGYGEGFAANSHRYAPTGFLPAIKYLVEELGADVNAVDFEGNTAIHHAAARGDTDSILYLVSKGADPTRVSREGRTAADMANGPVQRVQPFPATLAALMKLGVKNNQKCVSC